MAVTQEHRVYLAQQVANAIEEVELVDENGDTVGGPISASFIFVDTRAELENDIEFSISAGDTVAGWRAHGSETDFGGFDFDSPQEYSNEGTATLQSGDTYFSYDEA